MAKFKTRSSAELLASLEDEVAIKRELLRSLADALEVAANAPLDPDRNNRARLLYLLGLAKGLAMEAAAVEANLVSCLAHFPGSISIPDGLVEINLGRLQLATGLLTTFAEQLPLDCARDVEFAARHEAKQANGA